MNTVKSMESRIENEVPRDELAEMMVLSAMLRDSTVIGSVMAILKGHEFTDNRLQILFGIIVRLFDANKPANDYTILADAIASEKQQDILTPAFLEEVLCTTAATGYAEYHAIIVKEKAMKRQLLMALHASVKDCLESPHAAKMVIDRAEARVFEISDDKTGGGDKPLAVVLDQMQEAMEPGLFTGLHELDDLMYGLQNGEMIILAARPSVGKSALALNIADHVGGTLKRPVGVFSLEMKNVMLMERLVCSRAQVDMKRMRRNMLNKEEVDKVKDAVQELQSAAIYLDDSTSLTIMEFRAKARRMKQKRGVELVILDYIGLLDSGDKYENRTQEISRISRGVKNLAAELDIPILALCQLNRASETEQRRPRPSDLRESGSLEQDADVVLLLHREDVMHRMEPEWAENNPSLLNIAELHVAKQRNGPCGMAKLTVLPACTKFVNHSYQGEL